MKWFDLTIATLKGDNMSIRILRLVELSPSVQKLKQTWK